MLTIYTEKWWVSLVRGILALIIGSLAIVGPLEMLSAGLILFAIFLIADGIVTVATSIAHARIVKRWFYSFLEGFLGLLLGIFLLLLPGAAIILFIYVIAFWALMIGIIEIVSGLEFRKVLPGEWMMIVTGIMSIILSFLLFLMPKAGAATLIWILAFFLIVFGVLQILIAFRLRKIRHGPEYEILVENVKNR